MSTFLPIAEAIAAVQAGRPLIIVDDPGRENQGDLFFPAAVADAAKVNLMIQACRGLLCAPITLEQARRLELPLMVEPGLNSEGTGVNFMVSVDAREVSDFGISAADRAATARLLADPAAGPADLVRPGHVFPLLARPGGVLERAGHTEAATDLAALAGFPPAGVICEILTEQGEPARLPELKRFAKQHGLGMISIADLITYRQQHATVAVPPAEPQVVAVASAPLPTTYGPFQIHVYKSISDGREHAALVCGRLVGGGPVLTRVHSQCLTGDTFGSLRCDCQAQLHQSLQAIQAAGQGVLIYLDQEGRGIGLGNKIRAYALQDQGYDTVEANHQLGLPTDARDYGLAAEILRDLGVGEIDLLTNNPAKEQQLQAHGIRIHQTLPLEMPPNGVNNAYLATKKHKLHHRLKGV